MKTPAELRRDVYVRIVIAAREGRGVHLTPDEVFHLGTIDDAICSAAYEILDANGCQWGDEGIIVRKSTA